MKNEPWIVSPSIGCGPLRFGMSEKEVCDIAGSFAETPETQGNQRSCCFIDNVVLAADFIDDKLVCFELNQTKLPELMLGTLNLLTLPTMEAITLLEQENKGIQQAQGGSLYFDDLYLAILQFETSDMRSILMWASDHNNHEALAKVSLENVANYYAMQRYPEWPKSDMFGEDQKPALPVKNYAH